MAVADIISPWPTTPAALANARVCLAGAIGETDDATLDRLGSTAAALIERHAATAPQPIKNEAAIRCAGWLAQQPMAAVRSEGTGDIRTSFAPTHTSALRHSGAMALLSAWKVRRAGAIG